MTGAAVLAWTALLSDDPGVQLRDFISTSLVIGGPPATATWLIVRRAAAEAVGRDTPARLLALATAGLRGGHAAWGAAMRAELASIDRRDERRRFAVGRAWTALRTGWTRTGLLVAATVGAGLAATTLFSSRASLAGDRTGSLFHVLVVVTPVVLLAVAFGVGFVGASFRSGLEIGLLAMLGALVGIVAVAMPEGARWAETAGVFMLDGDAPVVALTGRAGALDALQSTLIFGSITWPAGPVIGAALGAALRRRRRAPAEQYHRKSWSRAGSCTWTWTRSSPPSSS